MALFLIIIDGILKKAQSPYEFGVALLFLLNMLFAFSAVVKRVHDLGYSIEEFFSPFNKKFNQEDILYRGRILFTQEGK